MCQQPHPQHVILPFRPAMFEKKLTVYYDSKFREGVEMLYQAFIYHGVADQKMPARIIQFMNSMPANDEPILYAPIYYSLFVFLSVSRKN